MSRLFPAWLQSEPGRSTAVDRRLPLALRDLRALCTANFMDPKKSIGKPHKLIDVETLKNVLKDPAKHWTRHVRGNDDPNEAENEKVRICYAPSDDLVRLQQNLAYIILVRHIGVPWHSYAPPWFPATAYGIGCSIITNAKFHQQCRSSFRVDLKDAFPSISTNTIAAYLMRYGVPENLAWVASRVFTFRGRLEQGASIAPTLFNALLRTLDEALGEVTGASVEDARIEHHRRLRDRDESPWHGQWIDGQFVNSPYGDHRFPAALRPIVYTRYGDDCCFSFRGNTFPKELEAAIIRTIKAHGFRINVKKTRRANNGNVDLPGVYIKGGRIRPNGVYIQRLKTLTGVSGCYFGLFSPTQIDIGFKTPEEATVAARKRAGHIAFIAQFGHGGRLKIFRNGTLHGLRFDTGRTRKERQRRADHEQRLKEERERTERAAHGIPEPERYI